MQELEQQDQESGQRSEAQGGHRPSSVWPSAMPHWLKRYAIAVGALAVVGGLRYLLQPWLQGRIPLMFFVASGAVAAWYGGFWPGLAAMLGGLILGESLFIPPEGSREGLAADLLLIVLYLLVNGITIALFELLHRSRRRAQESVNRLQDEIDRRQMAEQKLREREGQLLAAAHAARMGLWAEDMTTGEVWWSSELEDLAGMPRGSFQGSRDTFLELVHPDDRSRMRETITTAIGSGAEFEIEFRFLRRDGQVRWVIGRGRVFRDQRDRPVRISGVGMDVTDRKRAEEALQLTQFSLDHASDAAFWIDPQGHFFYVNEAACQALGYTRDELTRMSVPDIDVEFPAESWPEHWEKLRAAHTLSFESRHRAKTGRIFPVEITGNYVNFGGKEYVFSFARDITFRQLAERSIRESEERYRRLVELSPDAIIVHSGERILYANAASLHMLGAEWAEQVVGRAPADFVRSDFREPSKDRIEQMRKTGQPAPRVEQKWLRVDGTAFDVEVSAVALPWEGGTAFQVLARDITERRRVEAELRSYRERLEELVTERTEALRQSQEQLRRSERLASLGTLAAGIAHEINNPLNSIILTADYASQFPGDVEPDKAFDTIIKEAQRGGRIVKSVMKFARQDVSPKSPQSVNEVVARAAELARTYVHSTRLRLEVTLAPELPLVTMSPEEIEQVVINLVQNAVEAAEGEVRVRIRTTTEPDGVRISVEDDGPGISEQNLQRIFDPFFSTRHGAGGTGLGLSICYAIVAEHGGSIQVDSQLGRGSTFIIHLPINNPSLVSAARQAAEAVQTPVIH